jgi:hypothetical protein
MPRSPDRCVRELRWLGRLDCQVFRSAQDVICK